MKLAYEFKKYDYVVCTGLNEEQITAIVDRMVECGAKLYEDYGYYNNTCNTLAWDEDGETYFDDSLSWKEDGDYTEVEWEDIVKTEIKPKKLREIFPNGMYTDNSPEVFERFQELLQNDYCDDDEGYYHGGWALCGLDADEDLQLSQYDCLESYAYGAIYLTNEEFFAITLDDTSVKTIKLPSGATINYQDKGSPCSSMVNKDMSIGQLIEQIQVNTSPNSPRVVIDSNGHPSLRGAGIEVDVSGKSAEDIDKIYQALCVLMQEV